MRNMSRRVTLTDPPPLATEGRDGYGHASLQQSAIESRSFAIYNSNYRVYYPDSD